MIKVNDEFTKQFIKEEDLSKKIVEIHKMIHNKTGKGNDFLGWLSQPNISIQELERLKAASRKIRKESTVLVVIGIGGSYLGAKAGIELLTDPYKKDFEVIFAGYHMSDKMTSSLLSYLEDKDFSINVISKSGTTTEPAIAFRLFMNLLVKKYGKKADERIYITTDPKDGALRGIAISKNYPRFTIPKDIGGRFSVLTAVGLLPMAVAGIDIDEILNGAKKAYKDLLNEHNSAYDYAALRYKLYKAGKDIEILVSYDPRFEYLKKWWIQLFGESEGKDGKGLYVSNATFSTDLHSLGQMIQDGKRNLFETVIKVKEEEKDTIIPYSENNLDGLNYLEGKALSEINNKAFLGTLIAHNEGNVPNIIIEIEKVDAYNFGYLVYFFFKAVAMSAYLLDVNPFNQPGVEEYKRNMFALLGKKGYEDLANELKKKLK
ncbi:MAG: glucose-6-phosphate isomerase [Acholeplasmataceae bacterium]|jgi:glucose-6-phosphate isomerase|nr:glucose-6-phosphate isomerase [Acholeplasmataceae bacterium]